jgi:tetratricopeptide (TPR) repeat protein
MPLLDEARQRFEAIAHERPARGAEYMASACITEQGGCLLALGRLDEAASAYEAAIHRDEQRGADRDVAVGKGQLGTVRLRQRRYPEALAAYTEARERFTQLDEPGSVAVAWHQIGQVYRQAGQADAAEDAYRKSLAIKVRLGNVAGQAGTLGELGNLYDDVLDRPEEAAKFFRQAADKYVEIRDAANEGRTRHNLATTLRKLRCLEEARQEIRRAIECKAQFGHASETWMTWDVLADIETDAGNRGAAADATHKATACYLAYRRDGGENHFSDGRIALAVTESLLAGHAPEVAALLQSLAEHPNAVAMLPFFQALHAVVAGSRDRTLADAPDLNSRMAAEILFLIETLETAGK